MVLLRGSLEAAGSAALLAGDPAAHQATCDTQTQACKSLKALGKFGHSLAAPLFTEDESVDCKTGGGSSRAQDAVWNVLYAALDTNVPMPIHALAFTHTV